MPESRSLFHRTRRVIPVAGDTWAIHVYGPALRRNDAGYGDDDPIPVFAIHEPASQYRRFILVDQFVGHLAGRYTPEKPLPAGVGGTVVAALYTDQQFWFSTFDPWNWQDDLPPWIEIGDDVTKTQLYREVVRRYSRRNEG